MKSNWSAIKKSCTLTFSFTEFSNDEPLQQKDICYEDTINSMGQGFLEKLTVSEVVKKLSTFYGPQTLFFAHNPNTGTCPCAQVSHVVSPFLVLQLKFYMNFLSQSCMLHLIYLIFDLIMLTLANILFILVEDCYILWRPEVLAGKKQ